MFSLSPFLSFSLLHFFPVHLYSFLFFPSSSFTLCFLLSLCLFLCLFLSVSSSSLPLPSPPHLFLFSSLLIFFILPVSILSPILSSCPSFFFLFKLPLIFLNSLPALLFNFFLSVLFSFPARLPFLPSS